VSKSTNTLAIKRANEMLERKLTQIGQLQVYCSQSRTAHGNTLGKARLKVAEAQFECMKEMYRLFV